jgi:hypothetical protein
VLEQSALDYEVLFAIARPVCRAFRCRDWQRTEFTDFRAGKGKFGLLAPKRKSLARSNKTRMGCSGSNNLSGDFDGPAME